MRLDTELVRRGFARSRAHAGELVAGGRVRVNGIPAAKPATAVVPGDPIVVSADADGAAYVSRGGIKLAGALAAFAQASPDGGPRIAGRRCLDAGASTGGFTDVLLRAGATGVVAVDVGYGQLAWSLRTDPRVVVRERTNIRELELSDIGSPVGVVVADLSFISLSLVLPALVRVATADADLLPMVKPQFEVGRENVGTGGVVRATELRASAVASVAEAAWLLGLGVVGVVASPLPGPAGNVEYFLWLRAGAPRLDAGALTRAIAEGPS